MRITLRRGEPFCSSGLLPTLADLRIGKRQGERIDFAPIALFVPCYREIDPLASRIDSLFSRAGNSFGKLLKS
jgi:hypothetical protein